METQMMEKGNLESLDAGNPVGIQLNGRTFVVQDATAYDALLDRVEEKETLASIRRGLEQMDKGEGLSMEDFFASFQKDSSVQLEYESLPIHYSHSSRTNSNCDRR